jgi:hypothetical protein
MGRGIRLQMSLTVGDRERIEALLSGGTQEVRTVVRALALRQLDRGLSTPEVGSLLALRVRQSGRSHSGIKLPGWSVRYSMHRVRARCRRSIRGSVSRWWRWFARCPRKALRVGR